MDKKAIIRNVLTEEWNGLIAQVGKRSTDRLIQKKIDGINDENIFRDYEDGGLAFDMSTVFEAVSSITSLLIVIIELIEVFQKNRPKSKNSTLNQDIHNYITESLSNYYKLTQISELLQNKNLNEIVDKVYSQIDPKNDGTI